MIPLSMQNLRDRRVGENGECAEGGGEGGREEGKSESARRVEDELEYKKREERGGKRKGGERD